MESYECWESEFNSFKPVVTPIWAVVKTPKMWVMSRVPYSIPEWMEQENPKLFACH